MSKHYDICINGGGPIGGTLACLLAQAGIKTLLIERNNLSDSPKEIKDGRAYALAEGFIPLLEEAGIWGDLAKPAQPIKTINIIDRKNKIKFSPNDSPQQSPFGQMIEARYLLPAITKALHKHALIDLYTQQTAQFSFSKTHAQITLSSGKKMTSNLVIAADGRKSILRQEAGIDLTINHYNKTALVINIAHQNPHNGSALENFLTEGPFARLPLAPSEEYPHRSAIIWTDTTKRINEILKLNKILLQKNIERRIDFNILGKINIIGEPWIYPLSSQYASHYGKQRLILIGDAAHGLHPVAGQGMNMGLRDIRILRDLLVRNYEQNNDLGSLEILKEYQQKTRPFDFGMLLTCDFMEHLFSTNNPVLKTARFIGMNAINNIPFLKKYFIQQAMGI